MTYSGKKLTLKIAHCTDNSSDYKDDKNSNKKKRLSFTSFDIEVNMSGIFRNLKPCNFGHKIICIVHGTSCNELLRPEILTLKTSVDLYIIIWLRDINTCVSALLTYM